MMGMSSEIMKAAGFDPGNFKSFRQMKTAFGQWWKAETFNGYVWDICFAKIDTYVEDHKVHKKYVVVAELSKDDEMYDQLASVVDVFPLENYIAHEIPWRDGEAIYDNLRKEAGY